jgi:hypothetical protein
VHRDFLQGNREKQSLLPLTIYQVATATQDQPDDSFKVDGQELSQVQLVGCVVEMAKQSTNITYQIEDSTGRMEVKQWVNEDDSIFEVNRREMITEGSYVKVVGNLRAYNGKKSVTAFHVSPITDFNQVRCPSARVALARARIAPRPQRAASGTCATAVAPRRVRPRTELGPVSHAPSRRPARLAPPSRTSPTPSHLSQVTHHFLESIHVHIKNTKEEAAAPQSAGQFGTPQAVNKGPGLTAGGGGGMGGDGGDGGGGGGGGGDCLEAVKDAYKALDNGDSESGISVQQIIQHLQGKHAEAEIRKANDNLSQEGHIYSTIDDEHFKSTM